MPEHDLRERVTDQDEVDAGFIHKTSRPVVVSGQARDGLMRELLLTQNLSGDLLGSGWHAGWSRRVRGKRCDAHVLSSATPCAQDAACLLHLMKRISV